MKQQGSILVMCMLLLAGIALLAAAAMEASGLELKMGRYFYEQQQALAAADSELRAGELALARGDTRNGAGYTIQLRERHQCASVYEVKANGHFGQARAQVASGYRLLQPVSQECPSSSQPRHQRESWHEPLK